jgi:Tfp pilus assembly major pilin PilA
LNNVTSYYEYTIKDSDTPENMAEKLYKNTHAYWIITYANDIMDPQTDWPMNSRVFSNYLINKYGSVAASKVGIHHYEKVIEREEPLTNTITITRFNVNASNVASNLSDVLTDVPYDHYANLPETQEVNTINMNGRTVTEIIRREAITYYDWEAAKNDAKREIKIIKPEYYTTIMDEFDRLTNYVQNPELRKLY